MSELNTKNPLISLIVKDLKVWGRGGETKASLLLSVIAVLAELDCPV